MKAVVAVVLTVLFMVVCATGVLRAQEVKEQPKAAATEPSVATVAPAAPGSTDQKGEGAKPPAEEPVTGTASVSFLNQYMFRGYQLSKDSLIIQPSLTATYKGFSVNYWGNIDSHEKATQNFNPDDSGHQSFNETDLTLSYTYALGKFSLTGGYIYYGLRYANETQEFFGSISHDSFLKPTLSIYRDISAYPGWYLNLSIGHSFKIYQEVTLDLGASAGYEIGTGNFWETYQSSTGAYTGSKYSAFHDGMVKAGLTIPVTKKVVIQPMIAYWFPLSHDAEKRTDGNSYNPNGYLKYLWQGGVTVAYSF
jgi:hypothetical protein